MKFTISTISALMLSTQVRAISFSFEGPCSYDALVDAAAADGVPESTIISYLTGFSGGTDSALAEENAEMLCEEAIEQNSTPLRNRGAYDFGRITGGGYQFDNNYFDGGTYLNEEYEPEKVGPEFENVYNNIAQSRLITFPEDTVAKNFDNCQAQSVMCCWVQDRQANDNNGNCADNDCKNADPADNTNVCYMDLDKAAASNHVEGGYGIYSRTDDEGAVHCHGFAWEAGEDTTDYRYRGNLLFYVSMYDHMSERGYVREVPGAPMCGCLEKMPVVEESDCTEFKSVTETYTFIFRPNRNSKSAKISNVDIEYQACTNNELEDRFAEIEDKNDGAQEIFEEHIVGQGNCNDAFDDWLLDTLGYESA